MRVVWKVKSDAITDESIFTWEGSCEEGLRKYIPRKPHPNGFLSYGLCGWTYVDGHKKPVLLDSEPCDTAEHNPSAHEAFLALAERFRHVRQFPHFCCRHDSC